MKTQNDLSHLTQWLGNSLCGAAIVLIAMQTSAVVQAEEVKMYSHVPSANEMANLLFPKASEQTGISKGSKMRSISFGPVDTVVNTPAPIAESVGIGLPIQFDFNSVKLTSSSRPYVDELGKMLSREDLRNEKVVIEGHTDASGSSIYNQQLSMNRAEAIKQYLFNKYGIERSRLMISGKGEYKPLNGQDPYAAVNRRVEIHKYQ